MNRTMIDDLQHIKYLIDRLKAIDQSTLTSTEREACNDTLAQAYDRAAFYLEGTAMRSFKASAHPKGIVGGLASPPCTRMIQPYGPRRAGVLH